MSTFLRSMTCGIIDLHNKPSSMISKTTPQIHVEDTDKHDESHKKHRRLRPHFRHHHNDGSTKRPSANINSSASSIVHVNPEEDYRIRDEDLVDTRSAQSVPCSNVSTTNSAAMEDSRKQVSHPPALSDFHWTMNEATPGDQSKHVDHPIVVDAKLHRSFGFS